MDPKSTLLFLAEEIHMKVYVQRSKKYKIIQRSLYEVSILNI